jgi:hypothetical protein
VPKIEYWEPTKVVSDHWDIKQDEIRVYKDTYAARRPKKVIGGSREISDQWCSRTLGLSSGFCTDIIAREWLWVQRIT